MLNNISSISMWGEVSLIDHFSSYRQMLIVAVALHAETARQTDSYSVHVEQRATRTTRLLWCRSIIRNSGCIPATKCDLIGIFYVPGRFFALIEFSRSTYRRTNKATIQRRDPLLLGPFSLSILPSVAFRILLIRQSCHA